MKNEPLLSFEISENSDLEIHGNKYGFDVLLQIIEEFKKNNINNHCHLFADDLYKDVVGEKNNKIKRIKLMYWQN